MSILLLYKVDVTRDHVLEKGYDCNHEATKEYKTPPLLFEFPHYGEA
jgi:hypothetical protein